MIIDFHTHAFEDSLAAKAIPFLEEEGNIKAFHDGRISSLLADMDRAGIDRAVVCPIATKPTHFEGIRRWARAVRAAHPRIEMFLSIHPDDPEALAHADEAASEGFKGLKFHPYYQKFVLDDERLFPLYERIAARGLIAVFHTGYDMAYPPTRLPTPCAPGALPMPSPISNSSSPIWAAGATGKNRANASSAGPSISRPPTACTKCPPQKPAP